jgi:hypothetical protein
MRNMKILHLNNKKWVPVEKRYYDDEAHLQNLLTDDVNTLPLDEIGYDTKFVTIGKEVGLQNGSLDVLAVSPQGHIALIETKLDKNPEVKRTVVGQILGYAAYLWNKSYEDIENNYFRKLLTQQKIAFSGSLVDYMREKLGDDSISEAEFREGLEKRLRLGSFTLLIVVDRANQELIDIANYLNDRTGQEIDFYVIEMELVGDKQEQFLIPRLANPPRKNVTYSTEKSKTNDNYDRTPITQEEFMIKLSDKGKQLALDFIKYFENNHSVLITWRKNGFSLMTKLEKGIDAGGYTSFPYFFFQAPVAEGSYEGLNFGYPEEIYTKYPETRDFAEEYVKYYRSLPGYDEKRKTIKDLSIFDDKITSEFVNLIKITAEKLSSKERN